VIELTRYIFFISEIKLYFADRTGLKLAISQSPGDGETGRIL
jgi:hypothetical protein